MICIFRPAVLRKPPKSAELFRGVFVVWPHRQFDERHFQAARFSLRGSRCRSSRPGIPRGPAGRCRRGRRAAVRRNRSHNRPWSPLAKALSGPLSRMYRRLSGASPICLATLREFPRAISRLVRSAILAFSSGARMIGSSASIRRSLFRDLFGRRRPILLAPSKANVPARASRPSSPSIDQSELLAVSERRRSRSSSNRPLWSSALDPLHDRPPLISLRHRLIQVQDHPRHRASTPPARPRRASRPAAIRRRPAASSPPPYRPRTWRGLPR